MLQTDLQPYPTYKDSGVPWLGDVPAHWTVRKQRQVVELLVSNVDKHSFDNEQAVRLCNYVDVYKNDRITERLHFMKATATGDEIARFRLQKGDVLVTKDSESWNDIGVPALVEYTADDLICGYHLAILRPYSEQVMGEYLFRAIQSQGVAAQYYVAANGVTRYGLTHQGIKNVQIPVPPLPEQHAIARYLDHSDARINRLIRAKRQLIALLNEQKQAIIHRAVARGLDPDVALRPSGVAWLGDIPAHWEVVRSRYLFAEVVDTGHQKDQLLSIDRFKGIIPQTETGRRTRASQDRSAYKRVRSGQLAYNLMNAFMGSIGFSIYDGIVSPAYAVAQPLRDINPRFFHFLLRTAIYTQEYNRLSYGIMYERNRMYFERFKLLQVLVPPLLEQNEIVDWIDESTLDLNNTINRVEREIALIREYRARLIADVVTGKLDVRAAAAGLAEVDEAEVGLEDETDGDAEDAADEPVAPEPDAD